MAYPYGDPSGGRIAFYSQREQAPALAKARRGLQAGLSAYSPYENPSERDARARELLAGYGEGLGNIQLAGTRAGQALWGQEESLAAADRARGESTRRWEAEMELRRKAMEPAGLREPSQYMAPSPTPTPSGYKPFGYDVDLYGKLVPVSEKIKVMAPSQWSVGPGTKDPNWKKPMDVRNIGASSMDATAGLRTLQDPRGPVPPTYSSWAEYDAAVARSRPSGTDYVNTPFSGGGSGRPLGGPATGPGERFGPSSVTPITYGAGSEEAYRKAIAQGELATGGYSKAERESTYPTAGLQGWDLGGGKSGLSLLDSSKGFNPYA